MDRREDILVDLALTTLAQHADVAWIGGPRVLPPRLAARRVVSVRGDEALGFLHARARAPFDAILAEWPTRYAALMPFLSAARGALKPDGRAFVMDLVWQTAPTPELLRAFAVAPGHDKVRPVEGYEMQMEHSGFEVKDRTEVERARWTSSLTVEQRAAVDADTRGAAGVLVWALEPTTD